MNQQNNLNEGKNEERVGGTRMYVAQHDRKRLGKKICAEYTFQDHLAVLQ
jgi:hypothetical protein